MLAAMNVGKREEVAGEGQPATVNSVKPTGTVKPSASSLWLSTEVVAFSPRPHPYLPCFAPLSRERLSLHCSPN